MNQSIFFDYSQGAIYGSNDIKLDSNGTGSTTIILKKKFFGNLFLGNKMLSLYVDFGYNLVLNADNGNISFSGKGSGVNNYLLKSQEILDQLTDSVKTIQDLFAGIEKLTRLTNRCQYEIDTLYKNHYNSFKPDKELDYLLRASTLASVLKVKEEYIYNFEQKEIDSLNLIKKFYLEENNLLRDTLLIKTPTGDFMQYLWLHREVFLRQSVNYTHDVNSNTIKEFSAIKDAAQYGKEIKEFELFDLFLKHFNYTGPCPTLDSIAGKLKEQYYSSIENLTILKNKYKEYELLMPGNSAPHLQGISPEGKVISLEDFKGKVIFVDIWATWCSPCIEALPHIIELRKKFIDNKDVVFIFLSNDKDELKWKKYLLDHTECTGVQLRARMQQDRPFEVAWKVSGIPRYILVDKQGKIINAFGQALSDEKKKEAIDNALLK